MKTASGIEALAGAACALAEASAAARTACAGFARAFGTAFQIMDDVQNFTAVPRGARMADDDIAAGKVTYVVTQALTALPRTERAELSRILCTPRLRTNPAQLRTAHILVRQSGALDVCRAEARRMMDRAWQRVMPHLPHSIPRTLLHDVCAALL